MPEANTGAADVQGTDGAQVQGTTGQAHGAAAAKPDAGAAAEGAGTVDIATLQSKLVELERDNAKYRQNARERDEAQRVADEAKLSEAEREAKRLKDMETENETLKRSLQEERTRSSVLSAATRLGFADPGDAFRLIDTSSIELDDNGAPKNVDKLLADLLKAKPYLASSAARASGSAEGGVRGAATTPGADMNRLIRSAAGRG